MHQPYYRHPQTSEFVLPWVRLHASKDYLHMARLLQEFPGVKAHFTMVPSLRHPREDVRYVIGRQRMMASGVPHLYHRLEHDGQVEILTTPYYHPILPLIIDSRSALRGDPKAILPDPPFAYPDDAAFQIEEAIASHERAFGQKPRGMWPSERAISPEAASAIFKTGLDWFASDEGVLARSVGVEFKRDEVGGLLEPQLLYRPYRIPGGGTAIFRDRE